MRLRKILAVNRELAHRLDEIDAGVGKHDEQFIQVINAIRQLMEPPPPSKRRQIGFHAKVDEGAGGMSQRVQPRNNKL